MIDKKEMIEEVRRIATESEEIEEGKFSSILYTVLDVFEIGAEEELQKVLDDIFESQ